MSNICITQFQFTGTAEAISKIADLLHENEKNSEYSSGTPVEEILNVFGIEPEDGYSLDGEWSLGVASYNDGLGTLQVVEESAWEPTQTASWLKNNVEGIHSYVFYAEEPGEGIFATNDKEGVRFPDRFKATWDVKEDNRWLVEEVFAKTKDELVANINDKRGTHYRSFSSVQKVQSISVIEIELWDDIDG